jgi:hypothetical protein
MNKLSTGLKLSLGATIMAAVLGSAWALFKEDAPAPPTPPRELRTAGSADDPVIIACHTRCGENVDCINSCLGENKAEQELKAKQQQAAIEAVQRDEERKAIAKRAASDRSRRRRATTSYTRAPETKRGLTVYTW